MTFIRFKCYLICKCWLIFGLINFTHGFLETAIFNFLDKYCPSIWKMGSDPAALELPRRDALKRSGFSVCFCFLKCLCSYSIDRNAGCQIVCAVESLWHTRVSPEVKTDTSISKSVRYPCLFSQVSLTRCLNTSLSYSSQIRSNCLF